MQKNDIIQLQEAYSQIIVEQNDFGQFSRLSEVEKHRKILKLLDDKRSIINSISKIHGLYKYFTNSRNRFMGDSVFNNIAKYVDKIYYDGTINSFDKIQKITIAMLNAIRGIWYPDRNRIMDSIYKILWNQSNTSKSPSKLEQLLFKI